MRNLKNTLVSLLFLSVVIGGFYFLILGSSDDFRRDVVHPAPLIKFGENDPGVLTKSGVFDLTNQQRIDHKLDIFLTNELLDRAAEIKVDDMIDRQYFDHESPTGEGVVDLATRVGYEFIIVGENLAMGDFLDDKELVIGWMNSPGHRENIVNPNYIEMGVAVKRGVMNNREVWFAVQIFGLPLSICPSINESLLVSINKKEAELASLQEKMNTLKREIESTIPRNNQKIGEYNSLINQYNELINQQRSLINEYNRQVEVMNKCIAEYGS